MLLGNWQQKKSKQKLNINLLNFHKLHKIFINTLVINLEINILAGYMAHFRLKQQTNWLLECLIPLVYLSCFIHVHRHEYLVHTTYYIIHVTQV